MQFDLLVKGGEVVDDAAGLSGRSDVAVNRDRIVAVEPDIPAASAYRVIDAGGLHVAPGLIDIHAHVYRGATYWGVDADAVGSRTGVTSWID
ncbi:MAG: amidohydrolase family protein, partial [Methylobacteriaceae bacterium]|nr:amidohydrolase family protein [Methylobacteriaceae bacterium]